MRAREFEFVDDGEHRATLRAPALQNVRELFGRVQIKSAEGFIEQENISALRKRAGEENALLLTTREHADLPIGQRGDIEFVEGALHPFMVDRAEALIPPKGRVPALGDDVAHGDRKIPVDRLPLRQIRETRQKMFCMCVANTNLSRDQSMPAEQSAQKGAFAGAIGTENRCE